MTLPSLALYPCERQHALLADIDRLEDLAQAPEMSRQMSAFLREVAGLGLSGVATSRLISAFSDRLTARVVALTARRHRLPALDWCWLAMGSEGRHEQGFVTDQDNGLIFSATSDQEADALRPIFLPFAQEVNRRLADCGFTLCTGDIMAGNPAWCLSLEEWRERFIGWVRRPEPEALLNATIFFDLRPIFGAAHLGEELRRLLLALTSDTPAFLHLMAANALQASPPLNFLGDVVEAGDHTVDLKTFGSRIFVDAARIFALAHAVPEVNSAERLRVAGPLAGVQAPELAAVDAAFSHILRLRLDRQLAVCAAGEGDSNKIALSSLHEMDRVILRETLKQARRVQQRLKLNYAL